MNWTDKPGAQNGAIFHCSSLLKEWHVKGTWVCGFLTNIASSLSVADPAPLPNVAQFFRLHMHFHRKASVLDIGGWEQGGTKRWPIRRHPNYNKLYFTEDLICESSSIGNKTKKKIQSDPLNSPLKYAEFLRRTKRGD